MALPIPHLLLLTLLATTATSTELTSFKPRVVGGTEVNPPFKYPWMVALAQGGSLLCGGTLISPNYILTAAHCSVEMPVSVLSVHLHRHDLSASEASEQGISRTVSKVIVHPKYNPTTQINDFAVWKLAEPVDSLQVVTLDTSGNYEVAGTPALVMGWGTTEYQGSPSSVLLETTLEITDFDTCDAQWQGVLDPKVQLCAGVPLGGKDTCQGDSGGPILVEDANAGWVQIGVVSFGNGCAQPNTPGVYSYVYGGLDFVQNAKDDSRTSQCANDPCPSGSFCIDSVDTYFCNSSSFLSAPFLLIASLSLLLSLFRF